MQLDIAEQEQVGLLYITGFRSSNKWGGGGGSVWLNLTLRIRVVSRIIFLGPTGQRLGGDNPG